MGATLGLGPEARGLQEAVPCRKGAFFLVTEIRSVYRSRAENVPAADPEPSSGHLAERDPCPAPQLRETPALPTSCEPAHWREGLSKSVAWVTPP